MREQRNVFLHSNQELERVLENAPSSWVRLELFSQLAARFTEQRHVKVTPEEIKCDIFPSLAAFTRFTAQRGDCELY